MLMNIIMTNRYWTTCYPAPHPTQDFDIDVWETLSDKEILDQYWEWWSGQMKRAYYEKRLHGGGLELITPEKCIEDWCIVHWAERNHWREMKENIE